MAMLRVQHRVRGLDRPSATLGWALAVLVSLVVLVLPGDADRRIVISDGRSRRPVGHPCSILRLDRAAVIKEDLAVAARECCDGST